MHVVERVVRYVLMHNIAILALISHLLIYP
jgi:hypothetical protein